MQRSLRISRGALLALLLVPMLHQVPAHASNALPPPEFLSPTPADGSTLIACVGQPFSFDIRAQSTADNQQQQQAILAANTVTIAVSGNLPTGASHAPNVGGDGDGLGPPMGADRLVTGNPAETRFSFTPAANQVGDYTLTYTATDDWGGAVMPNPSSATRTITIRVEEPQPASLQLYTDDDTVQVDEQACVRALVLDQCGNPYPGAVVYFSVNDGIQITGFNQTSGSTDSGTDVTDENGEADFCYTPRFPGVDSVYAYTFGQNPFSTRGAVSGQGGFGYLDDSITIFVEEPSTNPGALAAGSGYVDGTLNYEGIFVGPAAVGPNSDPVAYFSMSARAQRNGRVQGVVTFTLPNANGQFLPIGIPRARKTVQIRSTRLDWLSTQEEPTGGISARLFGLLRVPGIPGVHRFRADALDITKKGAVGDRFVLTVLFEPDIIDDGKGPDFDLFQVWAGGNLRFIRNMRAYDVKVEKGGPAPILE